MGPAFSSSKEGPQSLLTHRNATCVIPSANRIRALIRVDNLTPGGEPDALVLLDMSEGALEVLDAQRLPDDHRVKRNTHDSRLLRAIGVKRVELIHHGPKILLPGIALPEEKRDIVDLHAVRDGKHSPLLDFHRVRLVVIVPVSTIN